MAKRQKIPELEGIASIEAVNLIEEKVKKCYSQEKYKEFQDAVEEITERYLKSHVGWATVVWILSLFGVMLAQKFLNIL